jgi:integrase
LGGTKPASLSRRICDFTESLKLSYLQQNGNVLESGAKRIVSLGSKEYYKHLRVLAWHVSWVLYVRRNGMPKKTRVRANVRATVTSSMGKTFVICRRQIVQLLRWPKSDFDHLAIKLPCLMAFRPEEVCTWRAEFIDWENGETKVFDAKKHKLFVEPLNSQVAKHAQIVLAGRSEGYVLQGRTRHSLAEDEPLTPTAIWYIWRRQVQLAVGSVPAPISPVVGRRFFAYEMYHRQPENLVELQVIMRHSDPGITLHYVKGLSSWEDVKDAYDRFQLSGFDGGREQSSSFSLSSCQHSASCRQFLPACSNHPYKEVKRIG